MLSQQMFPQESMIKRLRQVCEDDPRLEAAMLYGSFAKGEADAFSDIDCMLFFADEKLEQIDQREWVAQIAPVALYYHNEFGIGVTVFDNLVRAEFHFDAVSDIAQLEQWRGTVHFPSLESTLLLDRTGKLATHLQTLIGPPPSRDNPREAAFLCHSFLNWMLFGSNVLMRGEQARAHELLRLLDDYLLRMARLVEGNTTHWITPTKALEDEISTEAYERFVACTSNVQGDELRQGYEAAWVWGQELMATLEQRYSLSLPQQLLDKMSARLSDLSTRTAP